MTKNERRVSRRFLVRLPIIVRWTDGDVIGEVKTESREVSSRGLYFHLSQGLRRGLELEVLVTLPHELTHAGPICVRCLGSVLRSTAMPSGHVGIAAAMIGYEFIPNIEVYA